MCGIVGYVGNRDAASVIISGLHRLEYRGYDSAGIALVSGERLMVAKATGKIARLEAVLADAAFPRSGTGIGHTRWATHGAPSDANAHPHLSRNGKFAVVHNGIIENHAPLRKWLTGKGYPFASGTDTEVIAHLIEEFHTGDLRKAVIAATERLEGTYGIAVVSSLHPDQLVAARMGSPVVVGTCQSETIVASDVSAIVNFTKQVIYLNDGDILTATAGNVDIASSRDVPVSRTPTKIDWELDRIEKGGYEHFMLKEIHEQPAALADAIRGRLMEAEGTTKLSGMQMEPTEIVRIDRIVIAACGTSFYASMLGKYFFEDFAGIPVEVQHAAEFRYRNPIIHPDTYLLAVSQSGETADTLAAVREARRKGATVLGVCNVVGSTIAREAGRGVYLHAGPEIGVASTKAFTCQVAVLAMMAIACGRTRRLSAQEGRALTRDLAGLPQVAAAVLEQEDAIRRIAEKYASARDFFYIGRGYMYPPALEGALKLKEISYIHAEGCHAAELKHGPIALLDRNVPVVVAVPDVPGKSKTIGNIEECRARQAPVIAIATAGDDAIGGLCEDVIRIPPCAEFIAPIPVVIAEQLFAYHVARLRGCEIDQPRNLAKSVTVE